MTNNANSNIIINNKTNLIILIYLYNDKIVVYMLI
jgi:hypothetical protein